MEKKGKACENYKKKTRRWPIRIQETKVKIYQFIKPALCQFVLYRFALFQNDLAKFELIRIKNFQIFL